MQFWKENLITEQPLAECPIRTLLRAHETHPRLMQEFARYLDVYYPHYDRGHLLVDGGITNQPNRYLEYIAAIDHAATRAKEKYVKIKTENAQ